MKKETRYFDVFPQIVRAHTEIEVTLRPRFDHCRFDTAQTYQGMLIPVGGASHQMSGREAPRVQLTPQADGSLQVACSFGAEQEYQLVVERLVEGRDPVAVAEIHLYALEDDLFARRPFKGDTHMHTHHSDGKESPAYVAASCRRIGLDFIAITDHRRYAPSLEAQRAFAGLPVDLRIYPGEEIHPPDNKVHMVNFGGSFSINDLFSSDEYRREVDLIASKLDGLPAEVDRYPYASCVWCFDKIRQGGGLAIFCHPYWIYRRRYDVPAALTDLLFERQPFDALELIGGYHPYEVESNILQVARYHEERARGKRVPIVGASDSHGCETGELFGWYYTIAFAASANLADLVGSVRELYSVAVEAMPGEHPRAYGPLRLVQYAQFLLREIFPQHDELCFEEGRLMLAYAGGDLTAAEALCRLRGRVAQLYNHVWGA
jgi:hypothetical protein